MITQRHLCLFFSFSFFLLSPSQKGKATNGEETTSAKSFLTLRDEWHLNLVTCCTLSDSSLSPGECVKSDEPTLKKRKKNLKKVGWHHLVDANEAFKVLRSCSTLKGHERITRQQIKLTNRLLCGLSLCLYEEPEDSIYKPQLFKQMRNVQSM